MVSRFIPMNQWQIDISTRKIYTYIIIYILSSWYDKRWIRPDISCLRKITLLLSNILMHTCCRRHVEVKASAFYGRGSGFILVNHLRCTGNESSLQLCPKQNHPVHCVHSEDVGVSCFNGILSYFLGYYMVEFIKHNAMQKVTKCCR